MSLKRCFGSYLAPFQNLMGKRAAEPSDITIEITSPTDAPIILSFEGAKPAQNLRLNTHKRPRSGAKNDSQIIVYGETERIEYQGDNYSRTTDMPLKYAVGVLDPETGKLRVSQAQVVPVTQQIKALKSALADSQLDQRISNLARRDLGETFGTRKAQAAIRAYERGQIDMATLSTVKDHIELSIDHKAKDLDTPKQIEQMADLSRPIPPFDAKTEVVEQVYKLQDIITPEEMECIPYGPLMGKKRQDLIELRANKEYPEFVLDRLDSAVPQSDHARVQKLVYLTYLIKFRTMRENALNKAEVRRAILGHCPSLIEQRLLELFTEQAPSPKDGSMRYKVSSFLKDTLTSYICALCLHIDNFACNPAALARDLQLTPTKTLDLFKQLGCIVEGSKVDNQSVRKARLLAPIKFPKPPRARKA